MTIHPLLPVLLALLAAATGAAAQELHPVSPENVLAWPEGLPDGAFRRVALGRFGDDRTLQVLVVREDDAAVPATNAAFVVYDPLGKTGAVHQLSTATGWSDATVLPDGAAPGRDRVAWCDGLGLSTAVISETGTLADVKALPQGTHDGAWAGADQLVAVDVDGDGDLDLAARDAQHRSVLTVLDDGSDWIAGPTFAFAVEVSGFAFGNFDRDDNDVEVCVLIPNRIRYYDVATQTMLKAWTASVGGGLVARMERQDGWLGDVAVVAADLGGAGQWELVEADVFQCTPVTSLHLAPDLGPPTTWVEPTSLTTVDWTGEGDEDVLLCVRDFSVAYALKGEWDGVRHLSFEEGPYTVWNLNTPPATPTPADTCAPAVGAFTDGAPNGAVFPMDSIGGLYLLPHAGWSTADVQDDAIAFFSNPVYRVVLDAEGEPEEEGELQVDLTFPAGWEEFNHLQVVIWRQDDPTQHLIDQDALSNDVLAMDTSTPGTSLALRLPHNAAYWPDAVHYYVVARPVWAAGGSDGQPAVIESAGSAFSAGLTVNRFEGDPGYGGYLMGLTHRFESEVLIVDAPEFPGASSPVGAYVTLGRIPGFEVLPPMTGEPLYSDL